MPLSTVLLIVQILGGVGSVAIDADKIKAIFEKLGLKHDDTVTPEHVAAAVKIASAS